MNIIESMIMILEMVLDKIMLTVKLIGMSPSEPLQLYKSFLNQTHVALYR